MTLEAIYEKHKEWLYLNDTAIIDLKLAMEISRYIYVKEGGKPLWLILVAPSGSAKTEFLETLLVGMPLTTFNLRSMTSKSLITGMEGGEDLAPKLDKKLVIVVDACRFTSLYREAKREIFSQLRDLYDGFAGKHTGGTRGSIEYKNLKITMLWGAVPAIEKEIILEGMLGTRFLMYRYQPPDSKKAMNMIRDRISKQKLAEYKKETGKLEIHLCRKIECEKIWKNIEINEFISNELMNLAEELTILRATAEIDPKIRIPIGLPYKEEPTRIFGQFLLLYRSLMCLDKNYSHDRAIKIIKHVAHSSGDFLRSNIVKAMKVVANPEFVTTADIADLLKVSYYSVRPHLYILWNLGLIDHQEIAIEDAIGRSRTAEAWRWKSNQSILESGLSEKETIER